MSRPLRLIQWILSRSWRDTAADLACWIGMASDADELAARLDRIKRLTDEYLAVKAQSAEARDLAERIRRSVNAAPRQINDPVSKR